MSRIFINFRSSDSIFDCMLYSKELAPVVLDEGKQIVKLLFLAEIFEDTPADATHYPRNGNYGNMHSDNSQAEMVSNPVSKQNHVIVGNPTGNMQSLFHENVFSRSQMEQQCAATTISGDDWLILCVVPWSKCVVLMDAHLASCCAGQIHRSRKFRRRFLKFLAKKYGFKTCNYENVDYSDVQCDDFLTIPYMVDVVAVWPNQRIDYSWSVRICDLVMKKKVLEGAMAWLSTLGGGYSALGDYNPTHAATAGEVSLKQMKIAVDLGDPIMAGKCRLFWAQSRLQLGFLKECEKIVRYQFNCAHQLEILDTKLINMCLAVWSRLKYVRKLDRDSRNGCVKDGTTCGQHHGRKTMAHEENVNSCRRNICIAIEEVSTIS